MQPTLTYFLTLVNKASGPFNGGIAAERLTTMAKATPVDFDVAIERFKSHTKNSMKYAELCAVMSLQHFAEHGDTSKCQQFLEAMPKNYLRRTAYLQWLAAFSPIKMEDGKLLKDHSDNARAFNVEAAIKKPFWDFAPEKEIVNFTADEFMGAIMGVIKRFENAERMKPADDAASAEVVAIKKAVAKIHPSVETASAAA